MKKLVKELTPPIIWRLARRTYYRAKSGWIIGQERGAEFYNQTFLASEHVQNHYTKSSYYPMWTILADRIMKSGITSILDIGCGTGQFASFLQDKGLLQYLGIDFSVECIQQARNICPEFNFMISDVFETDLLSTQDYDAVVCLEFLEHIKRDLEILDQIRSGTIFFGTVPNFPSKAHVRHFKNAQQVFERYEKKFQNFTVDTHLANATGTLFFLMEGVKI